MPGHAQRKQISLNINFKIWTLTECRCFVALMTSDCRRWYEIVDITYAALKRLNTVFTPSRPIWCRRYLTFHDATRTMNRISTAMHPHVADDVLYRRNKSELAIVEHLFATREVVARPRSDHHWDVTKTDGAAATTALLNNYCRWDVTLHEIVNWQHLNVVFMAILSIHLPRWAE